VSLNHLVSEECKLMSNPAESTKRSLTSDHGRGGGDKTHRGSDHNSYSPRHPSRHNVDPRK
jgi:hypothetical protein